MITWNIFVTFAAVWILFFSFASFIVILLFIVPLQYKESKVKNGLIVLRKILLTLGVIFDINNLALASVVITHFFFREYTALVLMLALIVKSFLNFVFSVLGYKMYHTQYTDKNKRLHEKIEAQEERDARKVAGK